MSPVKDEFAMTATSPSWSSPSSLSPALLTKALCRAAEQLELGVRLPALLAMPAEEVERLRTGGRSLDPGQAEWGRALKIVGLFRTLVEVLGNVERAKLWLATPHQALGGAPMELLGTADAERVYRYLSSVNKHELRMPPALRREH